MSKAMKLFLEVQGIDLLKGDVWGHRKDINEYFVVNENAIEEIGNVISKGESIDDATTQIKRRTRLAPDLIKYIARSSITA